MYLSAPTDATVLCVDEKSQIQARNPTAPILPLRGGLPEKATHDYRRIGTTTVLAALDVTDGRVADESRDRQSKTKFLNFLSGGRPGVTPAASQLHARSGDEASRRLD